MWYTFARHRRAWLDISGGGVLLLLIAAVAQGQDTGVTDGEDNGPDCVLGPSTEGEGGVIVDWAIGTDGELLPELEIRAMDRDDLSYKVEGHVSFGSSEVDWEQGPYDAGALERFAVDVEIPTSAWMDDNQRDYVSTLVVRVVAEDGSGVEFVRAGAPWLKVVWPDGHGVAPQLMDLEEAGLLAPGGIYSVDEQERHGVVDPSSGEDVTYRPTDDYQFDPAE